MSIETAAKRSGNSEAVEEVLTAIRRRGPDGLDALVESLEMEEDANKVLITKIRECELDLCVCVCVGGWGGAGHLL